MSRILVVECSLGPDWDSRPHRTNEAAKPCSEEVDEVPLILVPMFWKSTLDASLLPGPFFSTLKPIKLQISSHSGVPAYQRIGSGVAIGKGEVDMTGLINRTWVSAAEKGDLDDIIVV